MYDFNVGDRVQCTGEYDGNSEIMDEIGTILGDINSANEYPVEFDFKFTEREGHSCLGRGKEGYCWWVDSCLLVPVPEIDSNAIKDLFDRIL